MTRLSVQWHHIEISDINTRNTNTSHETRKNIRMNPHEKYTLLSPKNQNQNWCNEVHFNRGNK